jgi:hypothetical protein
VFGQAVPSNNATTPTTVEESVSGFVRLSTEQQLNYLPQQRDGLPGQARPQPGINSSGINFPTPPKQFNPVTGELGPTPGSDLPISA